MSSPLTCPACKLADLDLTDYEAMMVLRPDLALFTLRCPLCDRRISTVQPIPSALRSEVAQAARMVGAGMGAE